MHQTGDYCTHSAGMLTGPMEATFFVMTLAVAIGRTLSLRGWIVLREKIFLTREGNRKSYIITRQNYKGCKCTGSFRGKVACSK